VAIQSHGWRGTRLFLAVCSFAFLAASQANAANRIALVIGNNAYENVPQLQKAVNNADAIAAYPTDCGRRAQRQ
jgi:Skp family chaperone for outer membrane proteins